MNQKTNLMMIEINHLEFSWHHCKNNVYTCWDYSLKQYSLAMLTKSVEWIKLWTNRQTRNNNNEDGIVFIPSRNLFEKRLIHTIRKPLAE